VSEVIRKVFVLEDATRNAKSKKKSEAACGLRPDV
jgi:hypothetical protein